MKPIIICTIVVIIIGLGTRSAYTIFKKSKIPSVNANIFNEHRSRSDSPTYGKFNDLGFYEDGTFEHRFGFSGGGLYESYVTGKYTYNAEEKTITLSNKKVFSSEWDKYGISTPSKIHIIDITENSVSYTEDKETTVITMGRRTELTSDSSRSRNGEYPYKRISFDHHGQCGIQQNKIGYGCSYWIVGDKLYLEVRNKTINTETTHYNPEVKTFLNIKVSEETVMVEDIDLEDILDGQRTWEQHNGQYVTNEKRAVTARIEYDRHKKDEKN